MFEGCFLAKYFESGIESHKEDQVRWDAFNIPYVVPDTPFLEYYECRV